MALNRDEWVACVRGAASVLAGFAPFVVAGLCASWWLAGGLYAIGVCAAVVVLVESPLPSHWRHW